MTTHKRKPTLSFCQKRYCNFSLGICESAFFFLLVMKTTLFRGPLIAQVYGITTSSRTRGKEAGNNKEVVELHYFNIYFKTGGNCYAYIFYIPAERYFILLLCTGMNANYTKRDSHPAREMIAHT